MPYRIGVDIGGTFTDFCVLDESANEVFALKVLSTPDTPGAEVMEGMRVLAARYGVSGAEVANFTHGTTVGVNTVIQRKGAKLALFASEGFTDVLELARLRMPESYSLFSTRPEPLITKDRVWGIIGRILADGVVDVPLDEASVRQAVERAKAAGAEGIVIAFLHAYRNPAHEQAAKALIRTIAPELFVFCSSEVWPVIREYERTTTSVINGYIHPRVSRYLTALQRTLKEHGVEPEPLITKSNGGVMRAELGKASCVNMVLSGTASGVMGATFVAALAGVENCLTLDIGGTSADVALIIDGNPQFSTGQKIGEFPLYMPTVAVSSIGDGGGSIAWVDGFGVLKVGPESAGSNPGPACYGRGGTRATITDAFAVCGFLGHHQLAYNAVTMDLARARKAVGDIAKQIGRDLFATAEAIIRVAISGMFVEVNKLIAKHGVDPREFALMTFGGAGPMMGCFLARELGISHVLVPIAPGVISALGGLIADIRNDFIKTVFVDGDAGAGKIIRRIYGELKEQAIAWLRGEQRYDGDYELTVLADMSYKGQSFEIELPVDTTWAEAGEIDKIVAAFHDRHEAIYAFSDRQAPTHIVNLRLVIAGKTPKPTFRSLAASTASLEPQTNLQVYYDGCMHDVPLFERSAFRAGDSFSGPAVIAQDDSTTCIPDGFHCRVDAYGNLLLTYGNSGEGELA